MAGKSKKPKAVDKMVFLASSSVTGTNSLT